MTQRLPDPQPIATAPRDGTRILALGPIAWSHHFHKLAPDEPEVWAVVYYERDEVDADDPAFDRSGWYLVNANPYTDRMKARLWLPLPPITPNTGQ